MDTERNLITQQPFPAFLMNLPLFLSADAANNVWMEELSEEKRRIDRPRALAQFLELYRFLAARSLVYLLPSTPGLQDQTYVANLGVVLPHTPEKHVVLSKFRSEPRRGEERVGLRFFRELGLPVSEAPPYFEGEADLKYLRENVYVGAHGMRTSQAALRWFADRFEMEVIPFHVRNEYLYHLDCSIFPITRSELVVCTEATDPATLAKLEKHVSILDVDLEDAESGVTNCVRLGDSVLCASHMPELSRSHEDYEYEEHKIATVETICARLGLEPVFFNLSEFLKSGAMLSCMIMHLNYENY